ncbi:MAG TPA: hypothetical protein VNO30_42445 [Kofleriaceae bacterium]|nr:hypothetical protein [Kofleriaceae bacterium]
MSTWRTGPLGAEVFEQLAAGIDGSELGSLLLEIMRRRAAARAPADVLAQYRRDRFTQPAVVDQRVAVAIDGHLLAAADGFEAIELSPLAPLGATSTFGPTDQHRVVSALRGTEVVSDTTNVLALECAVRLRAGGAGGAAAVHLATSQRVVRAQPVPKQPGFAQHFRLFALGSGGTEAKDHAFTVETLVRHVRALTAGLDRLEQHGYAFGARRVDVLATPERAAVADRVVATLGGGLATARKPLAHPYYSGGIRYMYWVTAPDGAEVPLADGGTFDWLARLLSNRRAVYVASGLGAQLVPMRFRRA